MASDNDIKTSIYQAVKAVLENASYWTNPFTVYTKADLESFGDHQRPTWPYIFLVSQRLDVEPRFLPIIILELNVCDDEWQLGNLSQVCNTRLHILASSEGQADRIADVLCDQLYTIEVKDYDQSPAVKVSDGTFIEDWRRETADISAPAFTESSLRHWLIVENDLVVF